MNIHVLQEHIVKGVSRANRIIGSKSQLPIISHILFVVSENTITLVATNLETTIKITLPGKIEEEGSICLPARLLNEFLSTLPKETVQIITDKETATVKTTKTKTTIPGVSSTEFPPVPELSGNSGVDLPKQEFLKELEKVIFSAGTDESRPLLTGVRLESGEKNTSVVTTDGYRLSFTAFTSKTPITSQPLVIPSRALSEVVKIGTEEKEIEQIRITETVDGQLLFTIGEVQLSTRRLDGEYPNFKKIIPSGYKTVLHVDTLDFVRAVKSAAVFARDSAGIIKITTSTGGIVVSANTPQVGENQIEVEGSVEGEGGAVAINSRFLLDLLAAISAEQLTIELSGALSPVVFRTSGDDEFFHIIMPVRVQE